MGLLVLASTGCESATGVAGPLDAPAAAPAFSHRAGVPVPPVAPVLEMRTPLYPAIAVYIVYREYVNRNPGLTTLSPDDPRYQRYVEKRLRELYPHRGYAGMMREAVAELRRNGQAWERYEVQLLAYRRSVQGITGLSFTASCTSGDVDPTLGQDASWVGQEEFAVPPDEQLPTIQMEIDSLGLVGKQVDDIYYYESLANGTYSGGGGGGPGEPIHMEGFGATVDDLIRAAAAGYTPSRGEVGVQVDPLTMASAFVAGGVMGWKAHRAATAHELAREKSSALFAGQAYSDTQRDAHRHIYWSMLLRRWVGKTLAKFATDWYEDHTNSAGPARVMDKHNNDIGRTHRYNSFRGHWLWDRWDSSEWAINVRDYINNESVNGEYIPEWYGANAITTDQAWAREACVPDEKYIFFSRDPS